MADLTPLEKRKLEILFDMGGGYVTDLTNQSFSDLIQSSCSKNIYNEKYGIQGGSKAKRLKVFWQIENNSDVGKVIRDIAELWKHSLLVANKPLRHDQFTEVEVITNRLLGIKANSTDELTEDSFLNQKYNINFDKLLIDVRVAEILSKRFNEVILCQKNGAYLSSIILSGSILEGIFLGVASKSPKDFNQAKCSPKNAGKVKDFHEWKLSEFIDVGHELKLISIDIKKFSHALRDFRNYIHPYEEMLSGFSPDKHTSEICVQVLKAAIASLSGQR
jgi:hypothetical protein